MSFHNYAEITVLALLDFYFANAMDFEVLFSLKLKEEK